MNIDIVNKINDSPYKCFVAITGGGQSFIGEYCRISGSSKTIVGCMVPYDRTIFDTFIGVKLGEYASPLAARKLAMASYQQCVVAGVDSKYAIGIGAASSIGFAGERIGRIHKINVAVHTYFFTKVIKVTISQGKMTRDEEDNYISELILGQLNVISNNTVEMANYTFIDSKGQEGEVTTASNYELRPLIVGNVDYYTNASITDKNTIVLFGGSFYPYHIGHKTIKELSEKILNTEVVLELSIKNADKGLLDYIDINERLRSIGDNHYLITKEPRIKDKVNLIKKYRPNVEIIFIVGADTWIRIWDEKYGIPLDELELFFSKNNVKFLVFGRNGININDKRSHLMIKSEEAANFNMGISSTELRKKYE